MATSLHAAELMVLKAAHQRNAEQSASTDTAVTKLFASEITEQVCNNAIQIHGGLGYLTDCPAERIYRDVRACKIYEGTSDIQRLIISRKIALEHGTGNYRK